MNTVEKTKKPLVADMEQLRQRIDALEASEIAYPINPQMMQLHDTLIENLSDAAIFTDLDFVIESWNKAAEEIYGWKAKEVIGKRLYEVATLEQTEGCQQDLLAVLLKDGGWKGQVVQTRKDGTQAHLILSVFLMPGEDNKPQGTIVLGRDVTQHHKTEESLRKITRAYRVLSECNQALVRIDDEQALLENICRVLVEHGGYRLAWIGFAEHDEEKTVRPVAQAGFEEGYLETLKITWSDTRRGRGPTGTAIRSGKPSVNHNILTNPAFAPWKEEAEKRGYASSLALPLISSGQTLGAINVYAPEPDAFAGDEVKLLMELANDLAFGLTAIHTRNEHKKAERTLREQSDQILHLRVANTAELEERVKQLEEAREAVKKRNVELARLYRASESLVSSPKPHLPTLVQNIVKSVIAEFGKSNCSLFLLAPNSSEIQRLAIAGPYSREVRTGELQVDGPGLVAKAIRSGKLINVDDVFAEDDYVRNWDAARSELSVPLKVGGQVIGAIDVQSVRPRAFGREDERLMTIFAERAALAVENARLFTDAQRRLAQLQALHDIDVAITSSLDLRLTLNILLAQVTNQLKVDAVNLLLTSKFQTLQHAAGRGFRNRDMEKIRLNFGEGFAGQAALERDLVSITDLDKVEMHPRFAQIIEDEGFETYFAVPLIAKGEVKGVLEIFHRSLLSPNPEWFNFLESLSEQAAIAIHNAELYDNLQIAKTDLEVAYTATLEGWVRALDMRDQETEGHTQRVTHTTQQLAKEIGVSKDELLHITRGALLHDIGKLAIPDSILHKTGPLNDQEWEIMRLHPIYAYEMLSPIKYLLPALDIPYCHHEKWDGSGYPRGLKGHEIPLAARIFAVVDVWDALRSNRPYRKAWSDEQVHQYIREQANQQFDPSVVEAFFEKILNRAD